MKQDDYNDINYKYYIMKKFIAFLFVLGVGEFLIGTYNPIMAREIIHSENRTTEWNYYGSVNALIFGEFDWLACIGDATKYESISHKFYELEDEEGYLLKPYITSINIQYRYLDGEKQYRMSRGGRYVYFSLNPYTTIEYVVDNNNRPNIREKDVSNYSHFVAIEGSLYFIKMN